jgi:type IV pilus biogenesis protein PilP
MCAPHALIAEAPIGDTLPSPDQAAASRDPIFTPAEAAVPPPVQPPKLAAPAHAKPALPPVPSASTISPLLTPADEYKSGMVSSGISPGADSTLIKPAATPQAVTDAVARLQKVDNINLDDMIRAQDAINRLDLLLEIEKRQTEIKKLRDERDKPKIPPLLSGAIPVSALNLPPRASTPMPPPSSSSASSAKSKSDSYAVRRIVGTEGRYMATIDTGGDTVSVHTGDTLPDESKVTSISLTSVVLKGKGKSKTLTIPSDAYIVRGEQTSAVE